MKIAELFAELGFNIDTKGLEQFNTEIQESFKGATLFIAKAGAVVFAINRIADASIRAATGIKAFSAQTGIAGSEIQQLQNLAELTDYNVTAEQVAASVQSIQKNLAEIRIGGGDVSAFNLLGIDIQDKDAIDVIRQVPSALKGLDQATKASLLERIGLDASFIQVFDSMNDEMLEMANQYILSDEAINDLSELGTAFTEFGMFVSYARDKLVALLSPAILSSLEILKGIFTVIIAPVQAFANILDMLGMLLNKIGISTENLSSGLKALGVVAGVVVAAFFPLIAIISAIVLIIEDMFMALSGGDSVIGVIVEWIDKLTKSIADGIKGAFSSLADSIVAIFEPIVSWIHENLIMPIQNSIESVKGLYSGTVGALGSGVDFVGDVAGSAARSITNGFNNIFNITTNNPQEAAGVIANTMQKQINQSYSDLNNAGAY